MTCTALHARPSSRPGRRVAVALGCALLALVLAFAIGFAASPSAAFAKSYEISDLKIRADLTSGGDMNVLEERTFDFSGSFTWVEWQLSTKGSEGITDIAISAPVGGSSVQFEQVDGTPTEPGTFSAQPSGEYVIVRAAIEAADEKLPVTLAYTVVAPVKKWTDTAEIYWKFVGAEWPVPARNVDITVYPPKPVPRGQVRAWAHGPLTGVITIRAQGEVNFAVKRLPPQTFVEGRILYPTSVFPDTPQSPSPKLAQILAEEKQLADAANRQRVAARAKYWAGVLLPALLALAGFVFALWAFMKYGLEHEGTYPGGYFREDPAPDMPPAVVGALWRFGTVNDTDVAAELMDLANRGIIQMQPWDSTKPGFLGIGDSVERTYLLRLVPEKQAQLNPLDKELVDILFRTVGDGEAVSIEQIKTYAKAHAESFSAAMKGWKSSAEVFAETHGLIEPWGREWAVGLFVAAGRCRGRGYRCRSVGGQYRAGHHSRAGGDRHRDVRLADASAKPSGQRAVSPVQGRARLPQGLLAPGRSASDARDPLGTIPRARGGVRHRRGGHRADASSNPRGASGPRHPDGVLVGVGRWRVWRRVSRECALRRIRIRFLDSHERHVVGCRRRRRVLRWRRRGWRRWRRWCGLAPYSFSDGVSITTG